MSPGLWVAREADENILGNTVRKSGSVKIIVCKEESDANRAAFGIESFTDKPGAESRGRKRLKLYERNRCGESLGSSLSRERLRWNRGATRRLENSTDELDENIVRQIDQKLKPWTVRWSSIFKGDRKI